MFWLKINIIYIVTHRCAFPHQALLGHNSLSLSVYYLPQNGATLCKTALLARIRTCTDIYNFMQMHAISCNDYISRIHSAQKIWWPEHPGPKSGQKSIVSQSFIPSLSMSRTRCCRSFALRAVDWSRRDSLSALAAFGPWHPARRLNAIGPETTTTWSNKDGLEQHKSIMIQVIQVHSPRKCHIVHKVNDSNDFKWCIASRSITVLPISFSPLIVSPKASW